MPSRVEIVQTLQPVPAGRRRRELEEFWDKIQIDPMAKAQEEYLHWMGQRPAWSVHILEQEDPKPLQRIKRYCPQPHLRIHSSKS
jgi:hypothetical protein